MKIFLRLFFLTLIFQYTQSVLAQNFSGIVYDYATGEPVPGAIIQIDKSNVLITDDFGKFRSILKSNPTIVLVSFFGFETIVDTITTSKSIKKEYFLKQTSVTLSEVQVVSDIAISRQTPVAFTNIVPAKIEEELAGRDIPMLLNTTPGVYATNQGGGDGDARVNIRGFNQRNIAVMLDGVPVNDMENGWVYWSNWFGLDVVTKNIQIQRGLGASKLAIPSVGGTLNIMTKGIDQKRLISFKQEVDSENKFTSTVGYNSGRLKGDWGITIAGAYKNGDGWVDATETKAKFYYVKVEKKIANHLLNISALGAPQQHQQRSYKQGISTYDSAYARSLGVDTFPAYRNVNGVVFPKLINKGLKYNQHYGYLRRTRYDSLASSELLHEKTNIYHKPQFTLKDFWSVNDRLYISNIAYLSIGKGGGTKLSGSSLTDNDLTENGYINWQQYYDQNTKGTKTAFGSISPIDPVYSDTELKGNRYLQLQRNEHRWIGLLSTFTHRTTDKIQVSGGLDLRQYQGLHYTTVEDMLGADYVLDFDNKTIDYAINKKAAMKRVGDTVSRNYESFIKWAGAFLEFEYKKNDLSAFVNISGAYSGYKKQNYFYNTKSDWKYKPSITGKGGLNYNLSNKSNVFINLGYINKIRIFDNFYSGLTSVSFNKDISNEKVYATEIGYSYHAPEFAFNINGYYTNWINKPIVNQLRGKYEGEDVYGIIPGMDALHRGLEWDGVYKISNTLEIQGLFSLGDWIWNKKIDNLIRYYVSNEMPADTIGFNAQGIHVSDAAQTQMSLQIRYEPIKSVYVSGRITRFSKNYADFNPEECMDENGNPIDSWETPAYNMVDVNCGYTFNVSNVKIAIRFNILNALNTTYITDALNNDPYISPQLSNFDATSASVFFGLGRIYRASIQFSF